jgi:ribonuclease J
MMRKGGIRMSEGERRRPNRGNQQARRTANAQTGQQAERARQARPSREGRKGRQPTCLRVIPLGGVGEVGKNCTLLEYGENLILVDAGAAFPGEDEPGVDLLVPDVSYIRDNVQRLRGIVLTHGHEDHIGGLAFVAQQIGARAPIPLYGSPLALGLARGRLEERKAMRLLDPRPISAGQRLNLGGLTIEFVPVGHSIPDAMALAIHSSIGTVIYTGDWKFADMPPAGRRRFEALGREGVTALLADCVRIESPGHTPPESVVARSVERLIRQAPARVIITTFASNIRRVADTINVAHRLGRACVLVGRSMERNISVVQELGMLEIPEGSLISVEQARRWPLDKIVLITTGSQGEPGAALARIAAGEHRQIRVQKEDTVIIAASPIPGNEETVARTIDNLFRQGANVHYPRITSDIHVSGHAARDDHAELMEMLRPRFVSPFHGEYRMMVLFQRLAAELGVPAKRVLFPELGAVMEFGRDSVRRHGTVPSGQVLVDGLTVGTVTGVVLRDRRALAAEGLLVVSVALDRDSGRPIATPELIARGLPDGAHGNLMTGARDRVLRVLERRRRGLVEPRLIHDLIKEAAATYIAHETGLRPMVVPVVTEV